MKLILGWVSLAGFTAALVVHALALTGVDVSTHFPAVWGLHVGIFVVFVPFVFSKDKGFGEKPTLAELRAAFPLWIVVLGGCLLAYAMVNFIFLAATTEAGSASIEGGKYVLTEHGKLVRELTEPEYTDFRAKQVRAFSGHWLVFYFVPFAYFMFHKRPGGAA